MIAPLTWSTLSLAIHANQILSWYLWKEIIFVDTRIYKGARFEKESAILNKRTYFKPTETLVRST